MPVAIAPTEVKPETDRENRVPEPGGPGGGSGSEGGSGRGGGGGRRLRPDSYQLGMWLALASISMMFIGFSSAYILGQGTNSQWRAMAAPPFVWINTVILLASSLSLELARRATAAAELKRWMALTCLLGAAFLVGQLWIWRLLADQGIYLSGNPHSSFFYLLTGVHGVHLLGGMAALATLTARAWNSAARVPASASLNVTALYWHFMDGLWIYLLVLLFFWR
ncbi:MAG: cytochrome c oxidase subunit 3 [Acidobacteriota bacterium]|nr:cytochrome c oxidase subunit 3 [Acidobacteriota bacterium]